MNMSSSSLICISVITVSWPFLLPHRPDLTSGYKRFPLPISPVQGLLRLCFLLWTLFSVFYFLVYIFWILIPFVFFIRFSYKGITGETSIIRFSLIMRSSFINFIVWLLCLGISGFSYHFFEGVIIFCFQIWKGNIFIKEFVSFRSLSSGIIPFHVFLVFLFPHSFDLDPYPIIGFLGVIIFCFQIVYSLIMVLVLWLNPKSLDY